MVGKKNRKPLVLRGARQVGKTTLVNEFSKNFDNYLYLNLDEPRLAAIFDTDSSTEEILDGNMPHNPSRWEDLTVVAINQEK